MGIPTGISEVLLPQDNLNVVELLNFSVSIGTSSPTLLALPDSKLFSKITSLITGEAHVAFLHTLSIPSVVELGILEERLEKVSENEVDDEEKPQSLVYPIVTGSSNIRLPLWVLEYWRKLHEIAQNKDHWGPAIAWLKRMKSPETVNILKEVPWKYQTPDKELANALNISNLSLFCSEEWLGNAQMDAMSAVLNDHLTASQIQASVHSNNFFQKLLAAYRFDRESYPTAPSTLFVRKIADALKSGTIPVACTAIDVRLTQHGAILPEGQQTPSNHWCALIIDANQHTLHYGDPMGSPPPPELVSVMSWWLDLTFMYIFPFQLLPITRQTDSFSCSILTINALAHYFFPTMPLLLNGPPLLSARIDMLTKTIDLLKKRVSKQFANRIMTHLCFQDPSMIANGIATAEASNFCFKEKEIVSERRPKAVKKLEEVEKKTKQKGKQKAEPHIPEFFRTKPLKKAATEDPGQPKHLNHSQAMHGGSDEGSDNDQNGNDEPKVVTDLASLIDITKPRPKSGKPGSGRPANVLINSISQCCYHVDNPAKHIFRCLGNCGTTYASRNRQRIVRHAAGCSYLPADLRKQAKAHLANQAPSRKLPPGDAESSKVEVEKLDDSAGPGSEESGRVIAVKKRKLDDMGLFEEAKKLGRKERHQKLDLAIVKLFCCSGIPTHIAQIPFWKSLFAYADPSYMPATRAKLEEEQIPGEAESIHEIQLAYLRTQENITVSCDGGTTSGKEAFWTIHMSTPDKKVYMMDVREATAVSHTAVWIKSFVLEVRPVRE